MNDQATTLRNLALVRPSGGRKTKTLAPRSGSLNLAITGGKGGVGKSNLSVNLALELGSLGYKVALLDADFGLPNADLLCGVTPKFHLGHVVQGVKALQDITIPLTDNVGLIPGGSGVEELANLSLASRPGVITQMREMEDTLDFMLIDTAAGIAENVAGILDSASEVVVVVTPEPTSIVDAYATIKILLRRCPDKTVSVVINNVIGVGDAEEVFQSICGVVRSFLGRSIDFLGLIPNDMQVQEAIREQVPVVQYAPNSPASRGIRLIAKQLHARRANKSTPLKVHSFWDALAGN